MADDEASPPERLRAAAEAAVRSIGLGFDMAMDCRLEHCKSPNGLRLFDVDDNHTTRDLAVPGGISLPNVPDSIKCGDGERMRFCSDVLPFNSMSEHFNQEMRLGGRIPSGKFNAAFEFTAQWQKDASYTKALAFDGVFISLFGIELEKSQVVLAEHVKRDVPPTWDPVALAKFIDVYGTHIVTAVQMGGMDVVYVKQHHSSPLEAVDMQKMLKDFADKRFNDACGSASKDSGRTLNEAMLERIENGLTFMDSSTLSIYSHKEEVTFFWRRRGGEKNKNMSHEKWSHSVKLEPEVISMTFVPISSLLSGVGGSGFLSHAINLYLRYKPPVEELQQFLACQLPRVWAPVHAELSLILSRNQQSAPSLQFSFLGPKLHVNTDLVDVRKRPVTGARLYLEGMKSNCLAIHLQHFATCPETLQFQNEPSCESRASLDHKYYDKVRWKIFSHVCTAPVESDDDLSIVTGAQFQVIKSGLQDVLFLQLQFSRLSSALVLKKQQWDGFTEVGDKSGLFTNLISSFTGEKEPSKPSDVNINSAVYPDGPPVSAAMSQLLRFVDTKEMMRGPQDNPGFWVVSGARLVVEKGKICLCVKYSLLNTKS